MTRHLPFTFARFAIVLTALALAVRVVVPSGFMLSSAQGGGLPTMVICTSDGAIQLPMPGEHAPAKPDSADHCAFASVAPALATPDVATVATNLIAFAALNQPLGTSTRPGLGLAAPPPPKTGPPLLA